jgi:pimeloyl-ACP methyl ester carboxylesterase
MGERFETAVEITVASQYGETESMPPENVDSAPGASAADGSLPAPAGHSAVALDGTPIAWTDAGTGSPLLLISGQGVDSSAWDGVLPAFAADHRVIVFDHRGTGASGAGDESGYTTRGFARDAVAVLDAAGVGRAHVYGHSMGGRVAQWLALDAPERVASLVLGATTAGDLGGSPRSAAASADLASGEPLPGRKKAPVREPAACTSARVAGTTRGASSRASGRPPS